jgi:hypothetical protein
MLTRGGILGAAGFAVGGSNIHYIATGTYLATGSGDGGWSTGAIDTTGADLLVMVFSCVQYADRLSATYFSDSKSNTWTFLTARDPDYHAVAIAYCKPTSVGTNHTVTASAGIGYTYGSLAFMAFSGAASSNVLDTSSGSTSTGTPGSITPAGSGELFITGVAAVNSHGAAPTLGGIFTDVVSHYNSSAEAVGVAYHISSSASAVNPSWSIGEGSEMVAFKSS